MGEFTYLNKVPNNQYRRMLAIVCRIVQRLEERKLRLSWEKGSGRWKVPREEKGSGRVNGR